MMVMVTPDLISINIGTVICQLVLKLNHYFLNIILILL
jgi:hypothetical protein